jgi:hypothetical protein
MLIEMRCLRVPIVWSFWVALGCGGQAAAEGSRPGREVPASAAAVPDAGVLPPKLVPSMPAPVAPPKEPAPVNDTRCPEVPPPPVDKPCDPLAEPSGCPTGQGCFPFVRYPTGPCEVEQYGTLCLATGPGTQGDSCEQQACAAQHICVSTGRGTQCVRVCSLDSSADSVCPAGLLCEPIDIQGFGGCL